MHTLEILTSDQYRLSLTRFDPENPNDRIVLICSATGVKQQFYASFADFLAEKGYVVYTYDYRGIGLSAPSHLKGFDATMRDWSVKDWRAVTDYLTTHHSGRKKYLIGHSIGGSFIGLSDAHETYDGFITVASQFGYWKFFNTKNIPKVLWFFCVAIPIMSRIRGYFPSEVKQLGEPLPYGVAMDWQTLILDPHSILALARQSENHYDKIDRPMLLLSVEDDWMATKKAVDFLGERVFVNARVERKHILLSETGVKSIGHMNLFRSKFRETLWQIPLQWLEKQL